MLLLLGALAGCGKATLPGIDPVPREVRGTWITTTANAAVATPADTASTMRRLRGIGLNTVYLEAWKNGSTQFPSASLDKVIGLQAGPASHPPGTPVHAEPGGGPARDLLAEMLIEAHRNGLIAVAWFEYGFMVADQASMPPLRTANPAILSRDIRGSEVAPNGFVWMNPLHPEARRLLLDIVLEAVDRYDLDGIQLDDRLVWPGLTMGYDDYTKSAYAAEHHGASPPADPGDPAWMRWRADKVNEFARRFVQEVRARRPGLIVSLSPAVYPWCWDNYLLEWPKWAAWTVTDGSASVSAARESSPSWDEFVPQVYRSSHAAFAQVWLEQVEHLRHFGGNRQKDLLAGIRMAGDGKDAPWEELRDSISLARRTGGGHVLWFSRGVLDRHREELAAWYRGPVDSPRFPAGWRRPSLPLSRRPSNSANPPGSSEWSRAGIPPGRYRLIGLDGQAWRYLDHPPIDCGSARSSETVVQVDAHYSQVELLVDRREEMKRKRIAR